MIKWIKERLGLTVAQMADRAQKRRGKRARKKLVKFVRAQPRQGHGLGHSGHCYVRTVELDGGYKIVINKMIRGDLIAVFHASEKEAVVEYVDQYHQYGIFIGAGEFEWYPSHLENVAELLSK